MTENEVVKTSFEYSMSMVGSEMVEVGYGVDIDDVIRIYVIKREVEM